ncbi:MAG: nucleotidyltransferase domain-containing protein [Bacteroidota bacterium]
MKVQIETPPIISDNIDQIETLCGAYNVKSLFVFGSVCDSNFDEESDIDFLVSFYPMEFSDYAETYFKLADELEHLFSRPVDLITDKSLANPYFVASVDKTKVRIYG